MTKEAMIKVLRYKAEHIKTRIKPEFFLEVADALEQQSEDAISRAEAVKVASGYCHPSNIAKELAKLPSVQPKYNTSEWCHDCKEYDQVKHCCPRYNKVIRNAVEEMKQPKVGHWITKIKSDARGDMWPTNPKCSECGGEPYYSNSIYNYKFCPYCGAKMVEPQAESEG